MADVQAPLDNPKGIHLTDACAALLFTIGIAVLLGWALEIRPLVSFSLHESYPAMKVNTALGMIMLGISLSILRRQFTMPVMVASSATLLIALGALYEHLFDVNLGINNLFFDDNWSQAHPGRMSVASSLSFSLAALLLITHQSLSLRHPQVYNILLLVFIIQPLISINAYLINAEALTRAGVFDTPSVPATLGFLCFCVGLIASTTTGISALLQGNDLAARQYRNTIFIVAIMVLVLSGVSDYIVSVHMVSNSVVNAFVNSIVVLMLLFFIGLSYESLKARESLHANEISAAKTGHKLAEAAMLEILAVADDAIILVDERRRIVRANSGAERIFGWSIAELETKTIEQLVPDRFRVNDIGQFYDFLASDERCRNYDRRGQTLGLTKRGFEKPVSVSLYKSKKLSDSNTFSEISNATPPDAMHQSTLQDAYVVAIVHELSGLETDMLDIHSRASIDHLTGIPDNDEFVRYCTQFASQEKRQKDEFICLMLIDMDSFKLINDRYEREFGDRVLQSITSTLKHRLRTSDKLFRYRSDKFVLVATNKSPGEAELMAERMRTAVKVSPTKLESKNIYVTCSIAVMTSQHPQMDLQQAVTHLETQLQQSSVNEHHDRVIVVAPLPPAVSAPGTGE